MAQGRPGSKPNPKPTRAHPPHPPHTPHCRCGTPMHPEHVEKHGGKTLERYCCPRRRWWNGMLHPHSYMEPREGVPQ
jgi:hypothetical protein